MSDLLHGKLILNPHAVSVRHVKSVSGPTSIQRLFRVYFLSSVSQARSRCVGWRWSGVAGEEAFVKTRLFVLLLVPLWLWPAFVIADEARWAHYMRAGAEA
jgi:hypothetical protein